MAIADPEIPHHHSHLANGLEVIIIPDRMVPITVVHVCYRVGSGDEDSRQSGFAHLYEHLFKNSVHLGPRHHYEVLRSVGASGNASTSPDRTSYHEVVPPHQLELALWLESDRMGYFLPGLTAERLERQQQVVRNERRQRYENAAYGAERFAVAEELYPPGHPHRHMTIGRHEDIEAATLEQVADFYRTWYVPSNAILTIGGDVEPAETLARVEHWFGAFPASTRPVRRTIAQPRVARVRRIVDDRFARLARVRWAWHAPAAWAEGDAELEVLSNALGATGVGRLWRQLVYDREIAQRVSVGSSGARLGGELHVVVDVKSDADAAEVEAVLADELARVLEEPLADREVDRALTRREAGFIWRLEGMAARVGTLSRYALYRDQPDSLAWDLARYRAVTPASVLATARRWLDPARRVEVQTTPVDM
jgi:zinc protease